jgi:hypothetical protein
MKTADLSEIWQELLKAPSLSKRGFRMRQCGASSHTRCYAAISHPEGKLAFVIETPDDEPRIRFSTLSTRAFSVDYGAVDGLSAGSSALMLSLHDSDLSDLFSILCADLASTIDRSAGASAVPGDVASVLERWRAFLQRRSALLTSEEVRGLIGELITLARLINLIGGEAAVTAWKGPIGGVRDFENDFIYAEAKTYSPSAGASVHISDALQLEAPTGHCLKLVCIAIDQSPSGFTLLQHVLAVESLLHSESTAMDLFRQRVAAAGFLPSMADAIPETFVAFEPRVFEVRDGFPRIVPGTIPSGVRSVRFAVELSALGGFAIPTDTAIGCRSNPLFQGPLS